MQDLLASMEHAYIAVARAELAVTERLIVLHASRQWSRRWGPPDFVMPWSNLATAPVASTSGAFGPEIPLVVSRVVLRSPGSWQFFGSLNPLEVIRKYLNDRHERRKDTEYRSPAEAERLAIENAMLGLDVLERCLTLEREYGGSVAGAEVLKRYIVGAARPSLEQLGQLDDRGLIAGDSAASDNESLPEDDRFT